MNTLASSIIVHRRLFTDVHQLSKARIPLSLFVITNPPHIHHQHSHSRSYRTKMSVEAAKEVFFDAEHFAVVGASKDPSKFGNKVSMGGFTFYQWPDETYEVLKWYKEHGLDAIPVHPRESSIEELSTIASVFDIHEPKATSLSIVTPPKVTLPICKTALLELGVNAVWLQPGAEDQDLKDWVESCDASIKDKVIYGGPCLLVDGEKLAQAKGKL